MEQHEPQQQQVITLVAYFFLDVDSSPPPLQKHKKRPKGQKCNQQIQLRLSMYSVKQLETAAALAAAAADAATAARLPLAAASGMWALEPCGYR